MNVSDLTATQLRRAAALKGRLEKLQKQLATILGSAAPSLGAPTGPRKHRKRSAAARARMSAAQKARWARIKAARRQK